MTNFEIFMKIKVKISKNLKIGDIGSIFSVKKVDNGMKPVVHHKNRIISSFQKSNYLKMVSRYQNWRN